MKNATLVIAGMTAASLVVSGWAFAQESHKEHHPEKPSSEQSMPMEKGMKPSEMPGGGMMGKGVMKDGKMGPGMMGKGMMGGMGRGMMSDRCPMMGMMMNSETGETHAAGRIAFIKAEFGITEAQQDAFDGYASALKANLEGMHDMRSKMMSAMHSGTPVDRLSNHIDMMEGRLATLKQVKPALEKLYGVLSDAQKENANKVLTGMGCMG
ncbi:MAG: Spy/CpxP family protein refolding chaperone [Filomicrobium sp.]